MARTTLTVQTLKNLYAGTPAANALDVTLAAGDAVDGNDYVPSEKDILFVQNSHGSNAYTFTLFSVADELGRTGDVTAYSLAAGEFACFPVPARGFKQTDGKIWLACENAAIKFAVFRLP